MEEGVTCTLYAILLLAAGFCQLQSSNLTQVLADGGALCSSWHAVSSSRMAAGRRGSAELPPGKIMRAMLLPEAGAGVYSMRVAVCATSVAGIATLAQLARCLCWGGCWPEVDAAP